MLNKLKHFVKTEPFCENDKMKYMIQDTYILQIQPNIDIKEFKEQIKTNASEINIYNKNGEIQEDTEIISTGMKIEVKTKCEEKVFTLIVKGDANGDGKADLKDILLINKHRLNKVNLVNEYLLAGDVTEDQKTDIKDILQINKFRLGKMNEI